jgi:hypothetical protein
MVFKNIKCKKKQKKKRDDKKTKAKKKSNKVFHLLKLISLENGG